MQVFGMLNWRGVIGPCLDFSVIPSLSVLVFNDYTYLWV